MKFCYFDGSGMGDETYLVVAGIIVDATRMHVTKESWAEFLTYLSKVAGRKIEEFHSRDFYRGNGVWRDMEGSERARLIEAILEWVEKRKHKCVFSGIDKAIYKKKSEEDIRLKQFKSKWCAAALHCTLQVQKHHQREETPKGHSVLIFDREVSEETDLSLLIHKPPQWIDTFYSRDNNKTAFEIVDVPFFADSKHILLAQVADLFRLHLTDFSGNSGWTALRKIQGRGEKDDGLVRENCENRTPAFQPVSLEGAMPSITTVLGFGPIDYQRTWIGVKHANLHSSW
jgi:GNAT superfamily N-acetyltransferase